jgi:hypothetical protein
LPTTPRQSIGQYLLDVSIGFSDTSPSSVMGYERALSEACLGRRTLSQSTRIMQSTPSPEIQNVAMNSTPAWSVASHPGSPDKGGINAPSDRCRQPARHSRRARFINLQPRLEHIDAVSVAAQNSGNPSARPDWCCIN